MSPEEKQKALSRLRRLKAQTDLVITMVEAGTVVEAYWMTIVLPHIFKVGDFVVTDTGISPHEPPVKS